MSKGFGIEAVSLFFNLTSDTGLIIKKKAINFGIEQIFKGRFCSYSDSKAEKEQSLMLFKRASVAPGFNIKV